MAFTPMSDLERSKIKSAKSFAFSSFTDYFFTYCFAFLLCALPCFSVYVISRAIFEIFSLKLIGVILTYTFVIFSARGYAWFAIEFSKSGKRDFHILYIKAFERPLVFFKNTVILTVLTLFPSVFVCFLPYALRAGTVFHIVCEILTLVFAFLGICISLSYVLFGKISMPFLRFCSSFWVHFVILVLTKGFWAFYLIPSITVSSKRFLQENNYFI